jgi:hypothetical protein
MSACAMQMMQSGDSDELGSLNHPAKLHCPTVDCSVKPAGNAPGRYAAERRCRIYAPQVVAFTTSAARE